VPILKDSMGGIATGAFWFTMSLDPKDETRSTSQGFYTPSRPNLHLLTGNQVTKLLVNSTRSELSITGVEYMASEDGGKNQVLVSKDIILAARALHTPQLLELSGIGDSKILSSYAIDTLVDLPGVGANYQDHPLIVTVHTGKELHCEMIALAKRCYTDETAINTANFSNATWNFEMRTLYDEKREGANFISIQIRTKLTKQRAVHYNRWKERTRVPSSWFNCQ
jgi:choline dehydrogenase-like flavoprotein